ncbi:hypothetical protein NWP96_00445 [Mycoplasmopsis cynos]|nr:hypothetical protein [Mycoplasmopsis cynos]
MQLLREIVFLKNNDEYVLFSGNFANNNAIKFIGDLKNKIQEFKSIPNLFNVDALNKIIKLHIKDAKISWYDYEGFSDIIPRTWWYWKLYTSCVSGICNTYKKWCWNINN